MQGGPRPCKFGDRCNKYAQGNCPFLHGNPNPNTYNKYSSSGFGHHQKPSTYPNQPNPNQSNYYQNQPNQPSYGGQQGFGGRPGYGRDQGAKQDEGIERQLCRMFQLGQDCKHGEKCRYKHAFLANNEEGLLRLYQNRKLPFHAKCRLTKFKSGNKDFFAMRNGIDINFFDFNFETKVLGDVFKYQLPDPNGKYNFYDHKNEYIYYSRENPDLHYEDMGIYNLQQQKHYLVPNSHQGLLTGIAHFKDNILISSSKEGELKVWILEGDQLQCHQESTQRLKSSFNPTNAKVELYFVDISDVAGARIVSAGTSDGRLLFWIGNELEYKQVQLTEQYNKVFAVRYSTRKEVPTALILTWSANNTHSAVLEIDLSNFSVRPLVEVQTTQDQPKNMLSLFELVHGYLMVANLNGLLSIYNYPETGPKVGVINHQNALSDIVASEDQLKNTNIKVKTMFILQKKTQQRQGSLGIYLLK